MTKHILIVEDDDGIRAALQRWLSSDGFLVTAVGDGKRALGALSTNRIDLVIMDINLPDTDGLRLTSEIRIQQHIGIIIVSGRNELMDRVVGLEMGADDYLTKPFEPREILARVRSVLRRIQVVQPAPVPQAPPAYLFDGWMIDTQTRSLLDPEGASVPLTSGEYQLLEAFVTHANRLLSRDQLIEWANPHDSPAYDRSIDSRIARLRRKLRDSTREARYIKTIRNGGYIFAAKVRQS